MIYRLGADAVLVLHLMFILFALFGGLLALWRRWMACLHLPALIWAGFIAVSGGICPLTPLENRLRQRAGASGYEGGFIEHYLVPLIYPGPITFNLQIVMAAVLLVTNTLVYIGVWRHWSQQPARQ